MNNAKHFGGKRTPRHGRRLGFGRQVLLLAALAVIAMGVVGGTVAYLTMSTEQVENVFTPGKVSCEIYEDFTDGSTVKKNVRIKNTGNTDAYIRVAVIITWKDKDGNISATQPQLGDYVGNNGSSFSDWWLSKEDGYWYYTKEAVKPGEFTSNLLDELTVRGTNDGYTLSVEILADAIQSSPKSAVADAWGSEAAARFN